MKYMLSKCHNVDAQHFFDTVAGVNRCSYQDINFTVNATRMSGEMDTSLSNGVTNYYVLRFLCHIKGDDNPVIVVEGDDGLTQTTANITQQDFADLGLTCKLVPYPNVYTASFCGIQFDPEAMVNITNPFKVILKTPHITMKYLEASDSVIYSLMHAKALSLLWQYPGCPIIQPYAERILKTVSSFQPKFNEFTRYQLENLSMKEGCDPRKPIKHSTRLLMQQLYDISPEEQLQLEEYITNLPDCLEWDHWIVDKYLNDDQRDYASRLSILSSDTRVRHLQNFRIEKPSNCNSRQQLINNMAPMLNARLMRVLRDHTGI